MPETNARMKVCHDTAANFRTNNPTLLVGEWALETDTRKMKIGDGATAYNSLPYSTIEESEEWQKPADWVDIRSGALPNSVYFLVAHSADYATYPTFVVEATVSNSGNYDVFVDGVKIATTATTTETYLSWQTLALTSGWDVTYPTALRTHIVRITPTVSTDTINAIATGSISNKGFLWVHFTTTNYISLQNFAQSSTGPNSAGQTPVFESVTSGSGKLNVSNLGYSFSGCTALTNLPIFVAASTDSAVAAQLFVRSTKVKKVHLLNMKCSGNYMFRYATNLETVELENSIITGNMQYIFQSARSLKKMPPLDLSNTSVFLETAFTTLNSLEPTFMDFSGNTGLTKLGLAGSSDYPSRGIKGVIVSNIAPFDSTSSPQLTVAYTGLDRAALVNLFKSMPYNIGYTITGTPTVEDGIASGFSSSNFLYTPSLSSIINTINIYELTVKITTGPSSVKSQGIIGARTGNTNLGVSLNSSGKVLGTIYYKKLDSTSGSVYVTTANALSTSADYTIKMSLNRATGVIALSVYDASDTLIETATNNMPAEYDSIYANNIRIGYTQQGAFSGSIDLNNTNIKVDGIPWFHGTAAMTKTISVVGASGTADLTAADKAIAEDKGWAITLS